MIRKGRKDGGCFFKKKNQRKATSGPIEVLGGLWLSGAWEQEGTPGEGWAEPHS